MKNTVALFVLIGAFSILSSCNTGNDDQPSLKFTQNDVTILHGGSQKAWRVISATRDRNPNSQISNYSTCHEDDTYTFKSDGKVEIAFGDIGCFWESPDSEQADLSYTYNAETGTLSLSNTRIEINGQESLLLSYTLSLEEISSDHLTFKSPSRTLILEVIN